MFVVKPRVFMLSVAAADASLLEGEPANTFLRSLVMVPPEVVRAAAKARAAMDEEAGKANLEKFGAKWTMNLKEMTPPDAPAIGLLRGIEFKPDSAIMRNGDFELRLGTGVFPDGQVTVQNLVKFDESAENKTFEIAPGGARPSGKADCSNCHDAQSARVPKGETFLDKYALKLTFGAKAANGDIPGTIYLCTPDTNRSFVAGSFTAKK